MKDLKRLSGWNPDRDFERRCRTDRLLMDNSIDYSQPSVGCFKIHSENNTTIMFYPKSATVIWKKNKADRQHKFVNEDSAKIIKHLKKIV